MAQRRAQGHQYATSAIPTPPRPQNLMHPAAALVEWRCRKWVCSARDGRVACRKCLPDVTDGVFERDRELTRMSEPNTCRCSGSGSALCYAAFVVANACVYSAEYILFMASSSSVRQFPSPTIIVPSIRITAENISGSPMCRGCLLPKNFAM